MGILSPINLDINIKLKEDIELLLELDSILNTKHISLKDMLLNSPKQGYFRIEPHYFEFSFDGNIKIATYRVFYQNDKINPKLKKLTRDEIKNFLNLNNLTGINFQEYLEGLFK